VYSVRDPACTHPQGFYSRRATLCAVLTICASHTFNNLGYNPMSAAIDIHALNNGFRDQAYVADEELLTTLALADALGKPLLIEGEAGVGKTEVAKCLAATQESRLIRLQCYEGLDAQHALYDWDYQRQLLAIQMAGKADPETLSRLSSPLCCSLMR